MFRTVLVNLGSFRVHYLQNPRQDIYPFVWYKDDKIIDKNIEDRQNLLVIFYIMKKIGWCRQIYEVMNYYLLPMNFMKMLSSTHKTS